MSADPVLRPSPLDISPLRIQSSDRPLRPKRTYVLYWMTAARRTRWNHALQHAVARAIALRRPLVVLEALRCDAPWSSRRVHRFILQGMADNAARFSRFGIAYHPYVEPYPRQGSGLLAALAVNAALVVTDLFPAHFLPRMRRAASQRLDVRLETVDSYGVSPLALPDRDFTVAHSFRRWLQKHLPSSWDPPLADPLSHQVSGGRIPARVQERWPALADGQPYGNERLPVGLAHTAAEIPERGGERSADETWTRFLQTRLDRYDSERSHPDAAAQSDLSPWLHFGHIGAYALLSELLPDWEPEQARPATGKRHGWWGRSAPVESFLDQLITWRELGAVQCHRDLRAATTYAGLPEWARRTLDAHRSDPRPALYTLETLAHAETSDPIWNAAQTQLVREGRIHNALRMLWGKRVLAWTQTPEEGYETLVELNNRYAIDGRDPSSWAGIGWVFGRYDRAWGPERPIYGKVRYMSSTAARRKWRLGRYLERYAPAPHRSVTGDRSAHSHPRA